MRIYYHSWGDEDILGSRIEIVNDSHENYTIKYEQEGFDIGLFKDLKINGDIINRTDTSEADENGIIKNTIMINFKAVLNPWPEKLFCVID